MAIATSTGRDFMTYGFAPGVKAAAALENAAANEKDASTFPYDYTIVAYEPHGLSCEFTLRLPDGRLVEGGLPQSPGVHNVLNAAGAIALIDALGFSAEDAAAALKEFRGVKRRFDLVGEAKDITVVDDYAHHPTEIAATLEAAKALGYHKVHVLFQPHRYSRAPLFCEVLHDEFGASFDNADTVTFMDVYSAGETPVPGVTGQTFLQPVLDHAGHPETHYVPRRIEVVSSMLERAQPGDLIITMGAGDVSAMGPQLIDAINNMTE